MLRVLAAALAGLIGFFPIFWLFTWMTGSNDIGAIVALPLGIIGVPVLVVKFWRTTGERTMRNRVLGAIGVIWGGSSLVLGFLKDPQGSGPYSQGQTIGFAFGGLLFVVGLYYLLKRTGKSDTQESTKVSE